MWVLRYSGLIYKSVLAEAADNFQTMSKSVAAKYRWEKLKYSNLFKNKQKVTIEKPA